MTKRVGFTRRFTLLTLVLAMVAVFFAPTTTVTAASNEHGFGLVWSDSAAVYATPGGTIVDRIYSSQGVTVLGEASDSQGNGYYKINYNTSRAYAYVKMGDIIEYPMTDSAQISQNYSVWYWNDASKFQTTGSVYKGETVALLGVSDYWYFIEYNTSNGRKRGYVPYFCVSRNGSYDVVRIPKYVGTNNVEKTYDVYSGPSRKYVKIGTVYANELVDFYSDDYRYGNTHAEHIGYSVPGQAMKAGYILLSE